jgi:hypothetical protein
MLVSLGTSGSALVTGCFRSHRRWAALLPFALGALLLVTVRLSEDSENAGTPLLIVAGALLIISSHLLNMRLCRKAGAVDCGRPREAAEIAALESAGTDQ